MSQRSVRLQVRDHRLSLRWSYQGERYYLALGVYDEPLARKVAQSRANQIEADLVTGNFAPTLNKYRGKSTDTPNVCALIAVELFDRFTKQRGGDARTLEKYSAIATKLRDYFKGRNADIDAEAAEDFRKWLDGSLAPISQKEYIGRQYKQLIQGQLAVQLGAFADDVHLIDGLPMRLCCITYAPRCQSFQDIASYGYCAAKDEYFYGFRGHLNISLNGVITGFTVTPANGDERAALWEISQGIQALLIGDKGYLSADLKRDLAARGIRLETPLRRNMSETRPPEWVHLEPRLRRLIETVNSQLSERFHFERIRCRDLWHLTSRVKTPPTAARSPPTHPASRSNDIPDRAIVPTRPRSQTDCHSPPDTKVLPATAPQSPLASLPADRSANDIAHPANPNSPSTLKILGWPAVSIGGLRLRLTIPAAIGAIFHLVPAIGPLFAPSKGETTNRTDLSGKIRFLALAGHLAYKH
jgi:Transposase DDE domain/Arm DNA-binding domain